MAVYPVKEVGEDNLKVQSFDFKVPAYRDEFGDVKGKDELWNIQIIGDAIDKHRVNDTLEGKKGHVKLWLNSKVVSSPGKSDLCIVNVTLASYEILP